VYTSRQAKAALKKIVWKEGKIFPIAEGPYRYRTLVHCSKEGRQRTEFANGERPYFCYLELVAGNSGAIKGGVSIVPILPDGRLIMVVEQRPAQYHHHPAINPWINGIETDLGQYGPFSSLEFPGGAIDPGQGLKGAFLQELSEETEVEEQTALCYRRVHPVHCAGSEIVGEQFIAVIFLSGLTHASKVETDGGLKVFALSPKEVQKNIWRGAISSGPTLHGWMFYQEVLGMRENLQHQELMEQTMSYVEMEEINIAKQK